MIEHVFAQSIPDSGTEVAALTKLFPPRYPPLARQARIQGEIEVTVHIRQDGSVESAAVASGHPLLKQAALDSAQNSQYECRGCGKAGVTYPLVYSFELGAEEMKNPPPGDPGFHVTQSQNRITIIAEPVQADIYFVSVKARSAKCMYMWRCGSRWGGTDYYYYRIRSARCLYAWKCGYAPRQPALSPI